MTISIQLRKLLHQKTQIGCSANPIAPTVAGGFTVYDKYDYSPTKDNFYYIGGASAIYKYDAEQDAWLTLPNSGIAGTFAAGACGVFHQHTAIAGVTAIVASATGTTTSFTINASAVKNMAGIKVRCISGTGVGYEGTITWSGTGGTSCGINVTPASSVAFDTTSTFRIYGGSIWFFNAGTSAVGFSVYDVMTNAWTSRSVTNLPTAWATDGCLVATPSVGNQTLPYETNTANSFSSTTIGTTTKAWNTNQWANYQVRISSGTGKGQTRTVASNTATVLTVSSAWTTTPDATSVYVLEGNDDYMYLLGNAAVTMYRYSISANTWTALAPTAARGAAPGAGMTASWIDVVTNNSKWTDGSYGVGYAGLYNQEGRYIYSFRGGASALCDVYDIAANTWVAITYGGQAETFTTGSSHADIDGYIYIQKEATGRIFQFDVSNNVLRPWEVNLVPQNTTVMGNKMFTCSYVDQT
jgi:hypothetical protein